MKTLLTPISIVCLLYGCIGCKTNTRQKDISKIIFASGYCLGECAFQAIEIDSSLTYKYYGGEYAKNKGYFLGTITYDFWNSINNDLKELEYWNLDTVYNNTYDDQSIEIIIYSGSFKKHISGQQTSFPEPLQKLLSKMNFSVESAKMKAIGDTIKFETNVQNPLRITRPKFPPMPKPAAPLLLFVN